MNMEINKKLMHIYNLMYSQNGSMHWWPAETGFEVIKLGFFQEDVSYREMQIFFMENLESDVKLFNEFHAQIVTVGNRFCYGKNPKCNGCPLISEQNSSLL